MATNDSIWEYNCPQYFDFAKQEEFADDDGADRFFDLDHEKFGCQRVLREISNTQPHEDESHSSKGTEQSQHPKMNRESVDSQSVRYSPRLRARWNVCKENTLSPVAKKPRLSSSNKPLPRRSSRSSIYHRAKDIWASRKNASALNKKSQPMLANVKSKVHSMETRQDIFKEIDFVSMLRRYDAPVPATKAVRITHPEPFKLSGNQNKQVIPEFKSMAQQIIAFQTKTPDRFRSKRASPSKEIPNSDVKRKRVLLNACSPKFLTKTRHRSPTCLSHKEVEEKEIEEMKKFQFRAQPVNQVIFQRRDVGVPKVESKPSTIIEPFHLYSDNCHEKNEADKQEEVNVKFQARPVPKGLFNRIQGVPQVAHAKLTVAQSPNFTLKNGRPQEVPIKKEETRTLTNQILTRAGLANLNQSAASCASIAPSIKWDPKPTIIQPFKFDQRDKDRTVLKAKKFQEVLEQEKKLREFHANPLPSLAMSGIPPKKKKSPTKCQPFQVDAKDSMLKKAEKWMLEVTEALEEQKKLADFKAKPCNVTRMNPFVPLKLERALTETNAFTLKSEERAHEREKFDTHLKEKEAIIEELKEQRQTAQQIEERKAIAEIRANAVHVAQPVRHFKGIGEAKPMPLTKPVSPELRTKKRLRDSQ